MGADKCVIFGAGFRGRAGGAAFLVIETAAIALLAASLLACLFARHWWVFDLASHFRPHYLAAAVLAAALALALRRRRGALLLALLALPHLAAVEPWRGIGAASGRSGAPPGAGATPLRVMTVNVNWSNRDRESVMRHIAEAAPDLLFLQEASGGWREEVAALDRAFPYKAAAGPPHASGLHVFSRFAILGSRAVRPAGQYHRYLVADLMVDGKPLRAVAVHAPNPLRRGYHGARNGYLRHLAQTLARSAAPTVVGGDFNVTRWSPFYADFVAGSGLRNAAVRPAWVATWPSWLPFGRIAIDHLLVSDRLAVRALARGPDVGSDHLPLVAELELL